MAVTALTKRTAEQLLTDLGERIDARDRAGAVRLALDAIHTGGISIPDLYTLVLGPFLEGIGSAWQHGRECVWQEHVASHIVGTVIEALYPDVARDAAAVPRLGRSVLLACPPREQHELGLRMLADRFELAGFDVVFLGADTPLAEIASAAKATGAELVALSVSTVFERIELRGYFDVLRAHLPSSRIVAGGPAFARDRSWPAEDLLDPDEFGLPGARPEG